MLQAPGETLVPPNPHPLEAFSFQPPLLRTYMELPGCKRCLEKGKAEVLGKTAEVVPSLPGPDPVDHHANDWSQQMLES